MSYTFLRFTLGSVNAVLRPVRAGLMVSSLMYMQDTLLHQAVQTHESQPTTHHHFMEFDVGRTQTTPLSNECYGAILGAFVDGGATRVMEVMGITT